VGIASSDTWHSVFAAASRKKKSNLNLSVLFVLIGRGSRLKSSTKLGTNQNGEKEEILKTAPNSAPRSDDARWLLALIAALS
jgi:hypothetical protein